jgi:hypothetical protein
VRDSLFSVKPIFRVEDDLFDRAKRQKPRASSYLLLNIPPGDASVYVGMNKFLFVAISVAVLFLFGCEQQPAAPSGGQPASSPSPVPTTTPAVTPSPLSTPSPESPTNPAATPGLTPATSPEATPSATPTPVQPATPESTSAATPDSTPAGTPDSTPPVPATTPSGIAPSPSSSPSAAESETRPTLSSQSANEYLQSYDAYISDFKTAYRAMKQGDMTKYQSVIQRAQELQTKSERLGGELNPEEEQRFANYLNKKANELSEFASQNH